MVPFGREAVEMKNVRAISWIVMLSVVVTESGGAAESVALNVMFDVPAIAVKGMVPVMAPVAVFKVRPLGRLPDGMLQVTAPVPPTDCKVALYDAPTTPSGKDVVLMASCGAKRKGEFLAAVNLPVPSPRKMETESSSSFTTAKSWFPSPLKSPMAIAVGLKPTAIATGFWNVPSQLLRSTSTTFARGSLTTRSWHLLLVKTAEAIPGCVFGAAAREVPSEMGEPVAWANVP